LGEEAYALRIAREFKEQTGRSASVGSVHSTLNRLSDKGFLKSHMSGATPERGGRRKRIYTITALGQRTVEYARELRVSLWNQYPGLATGDLKISTI
jgi:DNA-binding PadR family transcriptional regulator